MTETQILARLKDEQARYALQALKQPASKTEFEYGHRCGVVAGLDLAVATLLKMVEDENARDI